MNTPFDRYVRAERQHGVAPTRLEAEPGARTTAFERPDGRAYVGAPPHGSNWDVDAVVPLLQEAQRTAGVTIEPGRAYGFFTDTTLCIGCKACEVACKQWNQLPAEPPHLTGLSYDNTRSFSATTWRHVRFIEQIEPGRFGPREGAKGAKNGAPRGGAKNGGNGQAGGDGRAESRADVGAPGDRGARGHFYGGGHRGELPEPRSAGLEGRDTEEVGRDQLRLDDPAEGRNRSAAWARSHIPASFEPWGNLTSSEAWSDPASRWLLMSDVCKHCVHAPCMEACPTGSLIRTEFDSVFVQQDVCNGCGYCQSACPFGVIEVDKEGDGKAHKCTLCYDRLKDGLEPACAKACPTDSIQFGAVEDLLERARVRVAELRDRGIPAYLYGSGGVLEDDCDTSELGGLNCFFLLVDRPEVYNLPPVAKRPSDRTASGLASGLLAAAAFTAATMLALRSGKEGSGS